MPVYVRARVNHVNIAIYLMCHNQPHKILISIYRQAMADKRILLFAITFLSGYCSAGKYYNHA